jgi:hypothetical protein
LLLAFLVGAVATWAEARADDQTIYVVPVIPDDATKASALKRAYDPLAFAPMPRPILRPIARPEDKNELDEQADLNMNDLRKFVRRANYKTDICARHHMRKVTIRGGKSWRCR